MSVEITNNTIIKLLTRRGSNAERVGVLLAEGEVGFTVDTKRLYVGDGVTKGGVPTSNIFLGSTATITDFGGRSHIGDIVFKSDTNELFRLKSNDGSTITDWEMVASHKFAVTDNATLSADVDGVLHVNIIEGSNISNDSFGSGIVLASGIISLSAAIPIDIIKLKDNSSLEIPNAIVFNDGTSTESYKFPVGQPKYNGYNLITDLLGNLTWQKPISAQAGTVYINSVSVPVGTVTPYVSQALVEPDGWLFCDGRSVVGATYPALSAAIGSMFGGDDINFNLPNIMPGKVPFGAYTTENLGTEYPILTGVDASTELTGTSATSLSALSANTTETYTNSLSGFSTYYLIKHQAEILFEDIFLETTNQVLTAEGLSAYDINASSSTDTTGPSGQFALGIPAGDIGTGNSRVVEAIQRARVPTMSEYKVPGIYEYIIPNHTYKLKVTATGGGGHGYVRYAADFYRADGTQGGAGSTVIAYIDVIPGESYRLSIGEGGVANRTSKLQNTLSGVGLGTTSVFGLSTNAATIYNDISANGARETNTSRMVDHAGGGYAYEGFGGGVGSVPNQSGRIESSIIINGGNGGNFTDGRTPEGVGGSGFWGTGPAPGGGGAGWSTKSRSGETIAEAGNGIIIVETL